MSGYRDTILAASGLVAYYRLDETSGTTAKDSKGSNDGTFVNSGHYTLGVAGLLSGDADLAASFDGAATVGGTVRLPAFALGDGPLTVEVIIKRAALSGVGKAPMIAAFDNGLEIGLNPSNDVNPEAVFASKAGTGGFFTSTTRISDTTTAHHIVVTKNGATTHIYIDGVDQANAAGTNKTLANGAFPNAWWASDFNSTNPAYPGVIDEAAIYNVVLSQAQVSAHYQAFTNPQKTPPILTPRGTYF